MPAVEERVASKSRDEESHSERLASDANRNEVSREATAVREAVQALRSEIAVASERHRNAMERRQRAEDERREGTETGDRLDRELAAGHRRVRRSGSGCSRKPGRTARAQRGRNRGARRPWLARERRTVRTMSRQARDQMRTIVADRESALRELTELEARGAALDAERDS